MVTSESSQANAGGYDLLRRATQAMMSRYVKFCFPFCFLMPCPSPHTDPHIPPSSSLSPLPCLGYRDGPSSELEKGADRPPGAADGCRGEPHVPCPPWPSSHVAAWHGHALAGAFAGAGPRRFPGSIYEADVSDVSPRYQLVVYDFFFGWCPWLLYKATPGQDQSMVGRHWPGMHGWQRLAYVCSVCRWPIPHGLGSDWKWSSRLDQGLREGLGAGSIGSAALQSSPPPGSGVLWHSLDPSARPAESLRTAPILEAEQVAIHHPAAWHAVSWPTGS